MTRTKSFRKLFIAVAAVVVAGHFWRDTNIIPLLFGCFQIIVQNNPKPSEKGQNKQNIWENKIKRTTYLIIVSTEQGEQKYVVDEAQQTNFLSTKPKRTK